MNPRDAGFALAAMTLDKGRAAALAELAPRQAGAAIRAIVQGMSADALAKRVRSLRDQPGEVFAAVDASWIGARLIEAEPELIDAVYRNLPEATRRAIEPELRRYGRRLPAVSGDAGPLRRTLDAELVERFRQRAFPELGLPVPPPEGPGPKWAFAAPAAELQAVARECGLRVVARAFSRIGREDLARLCHGLLPQDSVRLVSMVVELNERFDEAALRKDQATHLRLMRTTGISQALFDDTGLAFIAAAAVSLMEPATRQALAWRLPEELGRRLVELAAPGALPEASAVEVYRQGLPTWLGELREQGIAASA